MPRLIEKLEQAGEVASIDWTRLPQQHRFMTSPSTYTCLSGGFGGGKTQGLCGKAILLSSKIPNNLGYLGRFDGKAFRHTTLQVLLELLPKEWIKRHNEQVGRIQLQPGLAGPEDRGSLILYGDFKDNDDLKNHRFGWFGIDQMEEVEESVWTMLEGRLKRNLPILTLGTGLKQFTVSGVCEPHDGGRHYAIGETAKVCSRCEAELPPFSERVDRDTWEQAWTLIEYARFGFGVCNPEGPSNWIYQTFHGLPDEAGNLSKGVEGYEGIHVSIYDSLEAGFLPKAHVEKLETSYQRNPMMYKRYCLGYWVEAEGLVYPEFRRGTHVVSAHDSRYDDSPLVLDSWPIFEAIDPGLTAPTAVQWWVVEPTCQCGCGKPNFWLVDNHTAPGPVSYHCAQIKSHRDALKRPLPLASYFDAQGFSATQSRGEEVCSLADLYGEHEIYVTKNAKDWDVGYDRITDLLAPDPDHIHPVTGEMGGPHLLVFSLCQPFIREIEKYKWKKARQGYSVSEEPADKDDDNMDAMNGFLATRPEMTAQLQETDVPEKKAPRSEDWLFEFANDDTGTLSHMSY